MLYPLRKNLQNYQMVLLISCLIKSLLQPFDTQISADNLCRFKSSSKNESDLYFVPSGKIRERGVVIRCGIITALFFVHFFYIWPFVLSAKGA